jgi:TorA maturation chaperone TorD
VVRDYENLKGLLLSGDFPSAKIASNNVSVRLDAMSGLSNVFMYLSLLLRYPEDEVYEELLKNLPSFNGFFRNYLGFIPEIPPKAELKLEYQRLFVNNADGISVPYASYYKETERQLMGESALQTRKIMANEGFALSDSVREIEDNIYIVFEFLSRVAKKLSVEKNNDLFPPGLCVIYRVFYDYIDSTIDEFVKKMCELSKIEFYKNIGILLRSFARDFDNLFKTTLVFDG